MSRIVIRQSTRKQLGLVFIGIIALLVSVFVLLQNSVFYRIVGTLGILLFSAGFIFLVFRLIRPKEILVIDENGFVDHSSLAGAGFVPWDVVVGVRVTSVSNQKFISVRTNRSYNDKLSGAGQMLAAANLYLGTEVINITLISARASFDEVLSQMQAHLSAYRMRNGLPHEKAQPTNDGKEE